MPSLAELRKQVKKKQELETKKLEIIPDKETIKKARKDSKKPGRTKHFYNDIPITYSKMRTIKLLITGAEERLKLDEYGKKVCNALIEVFNFNTEDLEFKE